MYSNTIDSASDIVVTSGTTPAFQGDGFGITYSTTSAIVYWGAHASSVYDIAFSISAADITSNVALATFTLDVGNPDNAAFRAATHEILDSSSAVVATLSGTTPALGGLEEYSATIIGITAGNYTLRSTISTSGNNGSYDNFSVDLSPVPEPTSAALIGLGGLALIARRRR